MPSYKLSLLALASLAAAAPCDIYAAGGTPCVAAHSTTRSLYSAYNGPLYQVIRGDGAKEDIYASTPGGVANGRHQDRFCQRTSCNIGIIYDQSGHGNHLTQAPPGGAARGPEANGYDYLSGATGAPVKLDGKKAYGVFISPATGYRNDQPNGTATGDQAQGIYAVVDGSHYKTGCCFDYGNAETDNTDPGNGYMETIYFGTGDGSGRGTGSGTGPWIMADLENGLFTGKDPINNPANPTIAHRFITAVVKGEPHHWAIRGGNARTGDLATFYDGARPDNGYDPMKKEGAVLLGVGGDNSNWAQGTFYEGAMTQGYPTDETEAKVQADIVAAKYDVTSLLSGPGLRVNSAVSFRVTTACCSTRYIAHTNDTVNTQEVTGSSDPALKQAASWIVRKGLGFDGCYSFESRDRPGSFIRHSNYRLMVNANDGSKQFGEDATFCTEAGFNGQGNTIRSWNYAARYWRHFEGTGYIAANGHPFNFDNGAFFSDDVSFVVGNAFA